MTASDALSLILAAGGVAGSLLRAGLTTSQDFRSRKTIADVAIGFFVGFLWPLYPLVPFPDNATMLQKAGIVAAVAYLAGDVLINAFGQAATFLTRLKGAETVKPLIALVVIGSLALAGCAPKVLEPGAPAPAVVISRADIALLTAGKSVRAVGQQFNQAGKTYERRCKPTAQPGYGDFCVKFKAYSVDFGKAYNPAVDAWEAAVRANDTAKAADAQTVVLQLATELLAITTGILLDL